MNKLADPYRKILSKFALSIEKNSVVFEKELILRQKEQIIKNDFGFWVEKNSLFFFFYNKKIRETDFLAVYFYKNNSFKYFQITVNIIDFCAT